ncbi:unnamed protein product [Zymoseptoria tritici ST99CH_1E4]|uniref:C3H1-type domain-containing protein n=1 Tax=Zymoseptoria tritici ST99CH_1E4 TaxID=1276532 RepID=A0A2H1GI63_ZYMTR|nr:unnamed protein product [Zymoseptoria tritici ST99CH_1E4]
MAPDPRPCFRFQQGKCKNGEKCNFSHSKVPASERKACPHHMKSRCNRGKACKWSHEKEDIEKAKTAEKAAPPSTVTSKTSESRMRDFKCRIPLPTGRAAPLGPALGDFWQQALVLVATEDGTVQETITLLAGEGGLLRVSEVLDQRFATFTKAQFARLLSTQLMPFLKAITHTNVLSSLLLRAKVITIYNIIYAADGSGERAAALFSRLATHLLDLVVADSATGDIELSEDHLEMLEATIYAFTMMVECNVPARANPAFLPAARNFTTIFEVLPSSTLFATSKARNNLRKLQQLLGIGQALPDTTSGQHVLGARATFELAKELPGKLSEDGSRHDNDHDEIRKILILPTLQEIQSSRNEYLPFADPCEWHIKGLPGLLDRNFRLLREDTVGQLRDAAKSELERLQNPFAQAETKHRGARIFVYNDVQIVSAAFDNYHGMHFAMRFSRPSGNHQRSKGGREEWWELSRRLGQDALICLLGSSGSATFFVVLAQGRDALKPTQLQKNFDLTSDPENAYVVVKPVDPHFDFLALLNAFSKESETTHSIVEFPGVLLPAFEPTLRALQRISESLDTPFPSILAPVSAPDDPSKEMTVPPPTYATRPGFRFNLSKITTGAEQFSFAPTDDIDNATAQLADKSSLDLGQARAVVSSLSRCFAAIQGPPGTGKSYTGVQLIRVLLANKTTTAIGPIIVCTQTNHALDAILERSVDDQVPGIVRIGGRSKSDRLADVNLVALTRQVERTKTEKSDNWELRQALEEETEVIERLLDDFEHINSDKALEAHLERCYKDHHLQLFGSEDDDGFITVKHKKSSVTDDWLSKNLPHRGRRVRSVHELHHARLFQMTGEERKLMLQFWRTEMANDLDNKLQHSRSTFARLTDKIEIIRTEQKLRVLRQASIIGITTSGLARNLELLRNVNPKVLICEEAGEVLEAHLLTALLPSVEHCILIGDHQQLRPQVQNYDLSTESRNGGQYALDLSLFERLVQPMDTFAQPLPFSTLEVQRRMHPSISQLVRQTQYPRLQDDPRVSTYPEVVGMRRRLFWMHHEELEDDRSDGNATSRTNEFEVEMIAALVKHLAQQGVYKASDIAVITPYLGQLRKLRTKLSSTHAILLNDRDVDELAKADLDADEVQPEAQQVASKGNLTQAIRLATVDNFQGEESLVVLVSLVRSNVNNAPGFLRTPNRINVLLSRAQHGMYILGNTNTTESVPMWQAVTEILQNDGNLGDALELCCPRHQDKPMLVQSPEDFARLSPEAGCDLLCDKQLDCGHSCVAKCHSEMLHGAFHCMKPCTRPRKGCEHVCPDPCGDKCDPLCRVIIKDVEVTLACGHKKKDLRCFEFQDQKSVLCTEQVIKTIPGCKHTVKVPCHVDVEQEYYSCFADCGEILGCGHTCKKRCSRCHIRGEGGKLVETYHGVCEQTHGSDSIKSSKADLLEFTLYEDIDLNIDPCIFTPCGHVFTVDSLDGTMDMHSHYEANPLTGALVGLKKSAEPFSMDEVKACPECRGSLTGIARYGRIVRRALLDESAKKLTAWSNSKHQDFSTRLAALQDVLMSTLDSKPKLTQDLVIAGLPSEQYRTIKDGRTYGRYPKLFALINDLTNFVKKLGKDEQPYQRVHDLVEVARRQQTTAADGIAAFEFSSEELQPREHLQASNLLNLAFLVLLGDVVSVHNSIPIKDRGSLRINLSANRQSCDEVIKEAIASKNFRQQAEASVIWTKFAAMECGVKASEEDDPGQQHRLDALRERVLEHLEDVEEICAQQAKLAAGTEEHPMQRILDEVAEVRKMMREGISSSEMRMVVAAMAKTWLGTGHWYRCENSHPFTVGECGMPMQLAKCPECGAGVGGEHHRSTAGVTHARDIEEEFGGMTL